MSNEDDEIEIMEMQLIEEEQRIKEEEEKLARLRAQLSLRRAVLDQKRAKVQKPDLLPLPALDAEQKALTSLADHTSPTFTCNIGVDIGGTLVKVACFERSVSTDDNNAPIEPATPKSRFQQALCDFITASRVYGSTGVRDESLSIKLKDGMLHFLHFQTSRLSGALDIMRERGLLRGDAPLRATGGGAFRFDKEFSETPLKLQKVDELQSLLAGVNFLLANDTEQCYCLSPQTHERTPVRRSLDSATSLFPYLLCNIGSGCSMLLVTGPNTFERVSGSCLGGGTYHGLLNLIRDLRHARDEITSPDNDVSDAKDEDADTPAFSAMMELAANGDAIKVSKTVGDIYGGDYEAYKLSGDTIAAAFGKFVSMTSDKLHETKDEDIAAGLLHMIGGNLAQLAFLVATQHKVQRILFAGNFLRQRTRTSAAFLSDSIRYWSHGKMTALFLKHEGYLGAVGCLCANGLCS